VSRPRQQPRAAELLDAVIEGIAQRVTELVAEKLHGLQPKPPAQEARYLNERAVAQRTGISVKTLQGWRCHGRGPPFQRAGRRVLYAADAVARWLESNGTQAPTSRHAARSADRELTDRGS
jgi:predicted DNA-binding transcriptional regulator AlpA